MREHTIRTSIGMTGRAHLYSLDCVHAQPVADSLRLVRTLLSFFIFANAAQYSLLHALTNVNQGLVVLCIPLASPEARSLLAPPATCLRSKKLNLKCENKQY